MTTETALPMHGLPSSLALDASAGGGWSEGFPWSTSATYTTGQARIPAGWAYETIVPVVATHPFHGIGGARSTFAWGGIRLDWVGVAADGVSAPTDYAHGYQPVFVGDRAPELAQPDLRTVSQVTHVPVCPNYDTRDVHDQDVLRFLEQDLKQQ